MSPSVDTRPRRHRSAALEARIGGLPGPFWWLWLGTLVNRAGTFIEPFLLIYLTGPRHVSVPTAGLVLTGWGFGAALSQPIGGVLADRLGRRPTLGLSLTLSAGLLLVLGQVRGLAPIAVLVFVLGVVGDMYRPASSAAVADLIGDDRTRERAYALQFWAINLGFSVASISAGVLLHIGFGLLFVLDAATTLTFGMLALRFVPETRPVAHPDHERARLGDPLRLLRADRLLLVATVLVLVYAVLYEQANILLPLAVTRTGLPASDYGYVISVNGVLIVILQPLLLPALSRWGRRRTLPAGVGLVGIGMGATVLCRAPWEFALTTAVWTLGEIATAGSFQALIAALAPAHMRGRYSGTLGLAWGVSSLVAPLLGAPGYAFSPGLVGVGCLVVGLVAAVGQYYLLVALEGRAVAAPDG